MDTALSNAQVTDDGEQRSAAAPEAANAEHQASLDAAHSVSTADAAAGAHSPAAGTACAADNAPEQDATERHDAAAVDPVAGDPADAAPAPHDGPGEPAPTRADLIIRNFGFFGHYLHCHGGGRSGREPILCLLHYMGGQMSQQELGMRFELKPGSLSEILAKMETSGVIERTRDPHDRRQLFVRLTQEGEQQAKRALKAREDFRSNAFTNLTTEEQDQLIELLSKVRTRWEELAC